MLPDLCRCSVEVGVDEDSRCLVLSVAKLRAAGLKQVDVLAEGG